jgi:predicted secreted protein
MKRGLFLAAGLIVSAVLFAHASRDGSPNAVIELEGNITTGYSWTYTIEGEGIVREVSNEYRQNGNARGALGSGGVFAFEFEGLSPGETLLRFVYARPWEKEAAPARSAVYVLHVDKDKRVTIR